MTEIRLYKSPWKALRVFAFTLPFVIGGVWLITKEDTNTIEQVVGWAGACFFGLGIPVGLFHLFDRRPQIIINEAGIYDRTAHKDFINWAIIQDAYPIDIYGQKFISLVVGEDFKPSKKKGRFYKSVVRLNEAIGAQDLNIQLGQIKINETKLAEFIKAMTKADENEKEKLIKGLSNKV